MRRVVLVAAILLSFCAFLTVSLAAEDDEMNVIKQTTGEFKQQDKQALTDVAQKTDFFRQVQPFGFGAKAADAADVKSNVTMPNLARGDISKKYNIVLQPGHYLRKAGRLGTSGKIVSEQQLTAFITANIATNLIDGDKDKKLQVLVISADDYDRPLNTDIFLSIHADGSEKPCTTGPSLGYGEGSSLLGMHALAFALATSLGQTYEDFQKDNFTTNLSGYYAFKAMKLSPKGFAGVLEVGELTCPDREKILIANSLLIAKNVSVALRSSVDIISEKLENK